MPPAAAFNQFWVEAGRAGAVMMGVETVQLSIRSQEAGGSDGSVSSARDAQGGSSPARSVAEIVERRMAGGVSPIPMYE